MATTTATPRPDRIERAIAIIRKGVAFRINSDDTHYWLVESSEGNHNYRVTESSCWSIKRNDACPDFKQTETPCKHMWAGPGANAAILIHLLRGCYSLADLRQTGELYAAALDGVPLCFVKAARNEYRLAIARICRRITFAPVSDSSLILHPSSLQKGVAA